MELAPGSKHCIKLAQGDAEPHADSEFLGCGCPLMIGDGKCCKEDERPLQEKVQESIDKEKARCEACKPKGQPAAPPA